MTVSSLPTMAVDHIQQKVRSGSGPSRVQRALDGIERVGNRLPDPALLFVYFLLATLLLSALLANVAFGVLDPRTDAPLVVRNLLSGSSLTAFLATSVNTFVTFPPLGVVLVAMLGIGVADHVGFIHAGLRALLGITARALLTPMLILVAILSHLAVDAGYVLVIPLGGVIFLAAGRHPLAGIAAAFAGVSGGFSATFIPVSLDPLLAGLTQQAAQIFASGVAINPLNNYVFTAASTVLVIAVGWWLTDRVVEPRLNRAAAQAAAPSPESFAVAGPELAAEAPGSAAARANGAAVAVSLEPLTAAERRGLHAALLAMLFGLVAVAVTATLPGSAWRAADGALTSPQAPLIRSIVPLIFLLFLLPAVVYGYVAGSVRSHRDVIAGMTKSMSTMGYYIVLAFFASQFIYAFAESNLGALIALEGAHWLRSLGLPQVVTLVGIVLVTCSVNLFVGSASAKWAILAPILVPMMMQIGISPDVTQAAYRIGDSSTNIITPLMPYFPLVVVFCQRYVATAGVGTVVALMLPYSLAMLAMWSLLLIAFWLFGIPLGLGASLTWPPPR